MEKEKEIQYESLVEIMLKCQMIKCREKLIYTKIYAISCTCEESPSYISQHIIFRIQN
jgi:hypothetical protein